MTNTEIRAWYLQIVSEIPKLNLEWIQQGLGPEERARRAYQIRHNARLQARAMMENAGDVEDLRECDRRLYGNPDGPTFDQLMAEGRRAGLRDDEVYERIIDRARTTNRDVDQLSQLRSPGSGVPTG